MGAGLEPLEQAHQVLRGSEAQFRLGACGVLPQQADGAHTIASKERAFCERGHRRFTAWIEIK